MITRDRRSEDYGRTLASYGIIGAEGDDIVTLQFVVVAPLTAEQIEARSVEGRVGSGESGSPCAARSGVRSGRS